MNSKTIEEAAKKYAEIEVHSEVAEYSFRNGALSDAAKEYWYEQFVEVMRKSIKECALFETKGDKQ